MTDQRHANQGVPEFHQNRVKGMGKRDQVARRVRQFALIAIAILLAGLARSLWVRYAQADTLAQRARSNAVLQVSVVSPGGNRHDNLLTLPGTLQGIVEAQLYARTNGYVKQWFKDIGQPVKKGELLATLDTPDIDKQVDEAQANYQLAKVAYDRWSRLRALDAVSQQEFDEKTAAYQQTAAELKRLKEQLNFNRVVAPFDGIVTRRNVDNGTLVNAGNGGSGVSGSGGQALFALAQIDRLHLYLYVPEDKASLIHVGDPVDIKTVDAGTPAAQGKVVRTAGAIDPTMRTLQVEVQLANANHRLLPGAYVQASFKLPAGHSRTLPVNTLLFGPAGSQVATVDAQGKVRLKTVQLGIDYGREVEIKAGVGNQDRVIINPPDAISEGDAAQIVGAGQGG
ncbi:efflux RND transporter periplasmic adaptor subunit [Paludibacterium sp.]|uniref:efflux RND transporter periplasmic adaptor subunit n=1 Tax=Paludibacterium sp. TaxID=1917523 RepID=UPI0025D52220|nr:efflux RND transporter periplasmic adaptor subunit [Paludibacterium sp.]MBV8645960.1 efflux RND transporter periplasmic adaptor subunit [Paludibacterium sp.]